MMVELIVRYSKRKKPSELSEEDQALIQSKKILEEDYDFETDKEFMSFTYDYIIVDFNEITEIMRYDKDHTQIMTRNKTSWLVRMPYNQFKNVYTQVTAKAIMISERISEAI